MTQTMVSKTRTVESKTLKAWDVTLKTRQGVYKQYFVLSNDIENQFDIIDLYCGAIVANWSRCPERDIETKDLETPFFDKLDTHWNCDVPYPYEQWLRGFQYGSIFDYVIIATNGRISAATIDSSARVTTYEKLGVHAHMQSFMNGIIDSGLPVFDFRNKRNL